MVIGFGGKECCLNVSGRLWGGALRDDTKNGCEGDQAQLDSVTEILLNLYMPNLLRQRKAFTLDTRNKK